MEEALQRLTEYVEGKGQANTKPAPKSSKKSSQGSLAAPEFVEAPKLEVSGNE